MKNTIALILSFTLTALTFVSCSSADNEAPVGFKEISGDAVDYDFFVPDEWQSDISTGITAAYYSSQDPSNVSMVAFELDGSIKSIEDYWNSYMPELAAVFPDIEFDNIPETDAPVETDDGLDGVALEETDNDEKTYVVGEPEQLTLDGVPALAYSYTASMSDVKYKFYQVISFRNSRVYIFTYTAEASNYDAHIEDVVGVLGNFRFN